MYLKSLEMQGFKSFADKVKLDFGPGITAVVGPNGSGKSNISDGIRWVLGEQSAKSLRGTKMEDIIFAGSSKRRPVGMAEISLTLDNSSGLFPLAYSEVTVTRRVFRSGEGEYLINKNACRLKDVHELFNDTGLGKEAFAIIGQGRVEEVLNSRAEDRRALIEEAAGIIKYRNRKREAIKKLEDTEQSLSRVLDIIVELGVNLEPLQAEAEKARLYQRIKNELDELEINLAVRDLEKLVAGIQDLKQQLEQQRLVYLEHETTYQTFESKLQQQKLDLSQLEEEVTSVQQGLHNLTIQLSRLENSVSISEERLKSTIQQLQRVHTELEGYSFKQEELHEKYNLQTREYQELLNYIESKRLELDQNEKELTLADEEYANLERQLEVLKNEIVNYLQEIANVKNSLNQAGYNCSYHLQSLAKNKARVSESQTKLTNLKTAQSECLNNFKNLQSKLQQHIETKTVLQGKCQEKEQIVEARQKSLNQIQGELNSLISKYHVLKDMHNDHEGYLQGVKSVLHARESGNKSCQGICGVVGELLLVPPEYEKAIEVALGGSVQNLVAKSDLEAQAAIEFLKSTRKGRATFLPLNSIQPRDLNGEGKKLLNVEGVIGKASDLVTADPDYLKVVQHLLGNILIVKDLRIAISLAKKSRYSVKMVTVEGDIINPGGSLTGGSTNKKQTGLLTRPREIKNLESQIAKKKEMVRVYETEREKAKKDFLACEQNFKENEIEIQRIQLQLATEKQGLQSKEHEISTLNKEIAALDYENTELEQQLEEAKHEQVILKKKLEFLQAKHEECVISANSLQDSLQLKKDNNKMQIEAVTSCKVELASLMQKENTYQEELKGFYKADEEINASMADRKKEALELEQQKLELNKEIVWNKEKIKAIIKDRTELESKLETVTTSREKLKLGLNATENEAKKIFSVLSHSKEGLHQLEMRNAKLESEQENHLKRLEEKYQLTFEAAMGKKTDLVDSVEAQNQVRHLQRELKILGSVSLSAIEEYDRLKERHDFLVKQEQDLNEARVSLDKVIKEIDQIMVNRFTATYEEVRKAFSQVFKDLFGGGNAQLELTNSDNMLETGIEIIAQPPGKKLQNLTLLSGGERALTAIALLFAILKVKPSPFCVLDEIEASLDEANVDRFADFLKVFSKKTQFVVISHRQGTIEAADALYGVTMEESGVSKLISVRLTETEKEMQSA